MIFNYVLPLSEQTYLDASFTYSPNDNVVAGHFLDTAMEKMRPVLESFHLQYAPGNPFADIVGGEWLKQTNQDLIDQHRDKLVKLFHSPAEPPSFHEEDFHHRAVD
ncbi:hypothetical protein ACXYTJ_17110 [Gilvimarinus sp. F26214L]|uniref:hypothetical protein n=1 Tax=Gilvimarinus sp. DZF01 TaxID=3461371 RepID=UPI004045BB2C